MEPPLKKRILIVLLAVAIQAIYIPTSLLMKGGDVLQLPIDVFPLWVMWVVPYILCYPMWTTSMIWLTWKMDEGDFRRAITSLLFTFSLGVSIFLLFPTYVVHPSVPGNDIFSQLLITLMIMGGDYDAFPSSHIYMTVVFALIYRDWYPRYKWLWLSIVVIVSLSTLFTKQHYILDVLGGYMTGWLGYRFGLWWNTIDGKFRQRRTSHA